LTKQPAVCVVFTDEIGLNDNKCCFPLSSLLLPRNKGPIQEKINMAEETGASQQTAMPAHGEFCWTEIQSNQAAKCKEFYKDIFGWQFKEGSDSTIPDVDYMEFSTGGGYPVGGLVDMKPEWFGGTLPPPHYVIYVAVDDVDANAEKAKELGGTILSPPMDIPNVGRFCIIQDPTGASIATFTMKTGGANG
jgi:predicted enzyme related to lactoylglutathione lyase